MSSRNTALAARMLTPWVETLRPLQLRLRSRTVCCTSPAATLMTMQDVPAMMNAGISWQSMVIDLVIVTDPNPPGSRHLISPLVAVLLIAPAKVLHGAVRLQGLASSPTPETQVPVACARAGSAGRVGTNRTA